MLGEPLPPEAVHEPAPHMVPHHELKVCKALPTLSFRVEALRDN